MQYNQDQDIAIINILCNEKKERGLNIKILRAAVKIHLGSVIFTFQRDLR